MGSDFVDISNSQEIIWEKYSSIFDGYFGKLSPKTMST